MAVIIFKPDPSNKKPKKEYIDLSIAHRKHRKMHDSYKKIALILGAVNLLLFSYIIFIK